MIRKQGDAGSCAKILGRPDFFGSGPAMLEAVDVVLGV
jgi:hypothetical protein